MSKIAVSTFLCTFILVGCATVEIPEISQSHPAHPEAEGSSISQWPTILELPEDPVVAPPLPIHADGQRKPASPKDHSEHATIGVDTDGPMYVCPMDPEITSDVPANCSKCGMKLVKKGAQ